jgi:hypothetical protein
MIIIIVYFLIDKRNDSKSDNHYRLVNNKRNDSKSDNHYRLVNNKRNDSKSDNHYHLSSENICVQI